jgi:hypothetical protein
VSISERDVLAPALSQPVVNVMEASTTRLAIATFVNSGNPTNPASDFTATIDWGDGTTTSGTVTGDGAGDYTVSGSHGYTDEGSHTVKVTLSDDAPGTASVSATNLVTVTESDILVAGAASISATEGFQFSGQVASFTNTGYPSNPASDFTASIDWGDGTTSSGTVLGGGGGILNVSASHTFSASGQFNVKVTLSDDTPGTASSTATIMANVAENLLAVGTGAGQPPLVNLYDAVSGKLVTSFYAFAPEFPGGVSVAVGDVNGDGVLDVIVAAGAGGGPEVKVIDGTKLGMIDANGEIDNGALLADFYAYDPRFSGGVFVAFGLSTGGLPEIITGAGAGGGPHVKVIDGTKLRQVHGQIADSALVAQFYAYDPSFSGGVRVAAADLNGDGVLDIVTGAGPGGGPHVKVINGAMLNDLQNNAEIADSALLGQFYAYTPTGTPSGGVYVSASDIGGHPIIITGDGAQALGAVDGPLVKVIDATKLNDLDADSEPSGAALLGNFFAYNPAFQGGVTVGAAEINGDDSAEIITGAGPGGGPHVKVINGTQLTDLQANHEIADSAVLDSFYAFSPFDTGGIFVGAGA